MSSVARGMKHRIAHLPALQRLLMLFNQSFRQRRLYPDKHPAIREGDEAFVAAIAPLFPHLGDVRFNVLNGDFVLELVPMPELSKACPELLEMLDHEHNIETITFQSAVTSLEVGALWNVLLGERLSIARALESRVFMAGRGIHHIVVRQGVTTAIAGSSDGGGGDEDYVATMGAQHESIVTHLSNAVAQVALGQPPNSVELEVATALVVRSVSDGLYAVRRYTPASGLDSVTRHSANVALLCTALGQNLGVPKELLRTLALAGLTHDLGKLLLPDQLSGGSIIELSEADRARWAMHTELGAQIVSLLPERDPVLPLAALRHHEAYPTSRKRTHVGQLVLEVVAICNRYDSLRFGYRTRSVTADDAARQLVQDAEKRFDPRLVKVLLSAIGLFPPGTEVRLSSGAVGVVVRANLADALRPSVQLVQSAEGLGFLEPFVIDLTQASDIRFCFRDSIVEELSSVPRATGMTHPPPKQPSLAPTSGVFDLDSPFAEEPSSLSALSLSAAELLGEGSRKPW